MKARVAASIVLALAVAVGTAGCGFIAPQATTKHYDASDGVSGNVGQIDVRNAFIVTDGVLESGPVRMDVERHVVLVNGAAITLPLKEFDLLEYLMRNSGRVLTRGQLIDRVWGADYVGDTKTLDVHIKRIRSRIEESPSDPQMLVTVRGLGYRFNS